MDMKTMVFMGTFFIFGAILMGVSDNMHTKLKGCVDKDIHNANKALLVISVILMTASISFMLCEWKCKSCQFSVGLTSLVVILFVLGIILTVLGAMIKNSDKTGCKGSKIKDSANAVMGIGIGLILLIFLYVVSIVYQNRSSISSKIDDNRGKLRRNRVNPVVPGDNIPSQEFNF